MRYFWSDGTGKYLLLVSYIKKKVIIYKKFVFYSQVQRGFAERYICTMIESAQTRLIYLIYL